MKAVPFRLEANVIHRELNPDFCWFHPRPAAIPGFGKGGQPAVVMTLQKHLAASDHYSGLCWMRSDDLGKTWTGPAAIPELAWQPQPDGTTISVCDVTPGWHAPTRKLIAIGVQVRYSRTGGQLLDRPRSHEGAYAIFDPLTNAWAPWKTLVLPDTDALFFLVNPGCGQWVVKPDGTVLLPVYFRGPSGDDESSTVLECSFDGATLTYRRHGDTLTVREGRGLCEPSLAFCRGRYYLTLRNDERGYVTDGDDGLHFAPIRPWTFDDGRDLGSYNTQQHWLTHGDGLFLAYTRRGANNDHVFRNRAPLFMAQVDPERLCVIHSTERVLIPERGVPLGNFGAAAITAAESWVTDAEFIVADRPHPRGGDGAVWVARVLWP